MTFPRPLFGGAAGAGSDALIYRYRAGATFRHRFDVVNRGDLPIRVLVPQPIDRLAYAELVSVEPATEARTSSARGNSSTAECRGAT